MKSRQLSRCALCLLLSLMMIVSLLQNFSVKNHYIVVPDGNVEYGETTVDFFWTAAGMTKSSSVTLTSDDKTKYEQLATLTKTMLDYGAKAQLRFGLDTGNLANNGTDYYSGVETVAKRADNMLYGLDAVGLRYVGSSVTYLSEMTLKHYYVIEDDSLFTVAIQSGITFDGESVTYGEHNGMIYFEKTGIAAPDLDTLYAISIGGRDYRYSVLDYSALVLESSTTSQAAKDLASAVYRYNQAANAFYDE